MEEFAMKVKTNEMVLASPNPPRHTSSKYDFVKVRVWLGENLDHYYVLSRFLISRMLTVTKIPHVIAIKIALELKKLLVDASLLDISQTDLETNLFKLMERRGFGSEYVNRYRMMTRFYHLRIPLVILICGTCCVGKSVIATQLAQRFNLPNVLQTEMVYELLRTSFDSPLHPTPLWQESFSSEQDLISEYKRECRIVHKGLNGELKKVLREGKPVIIEGLHIDPSLYLQEISNPNLNPNLNLNTNLNLNPNPNPNPNDDQNANQSEAEIEIEVEKEKEKKKKKEIENENENEKQKNKKDEHASEKCLKKEEEKNLKSNSNSNSKSKSIIIPILLKMEEEDHGMLLDEWILYHNKNMKNIAEEKQNLLTRLQIIQNYLSSFSIQGLKVIDISPTNFSKVLDSIHDYVLTSIEKYFDPNGVI